jgi:hypothetical protein
MAFPYQPTGNPTNVTFSPVGIICQLSHYKALILHDKPLEMMEKHPVEDGPLQMSGTIKVIPFHFLFALTMPLVTDCSSPSAISLFKVEK